MEIEIPDSIKHLYEEGRNPVVKIPNPVLRQMCLPVQKITKKTQQFIDDLVYWSLNADGVGISAPQLGRLERIMIVDPEVGNPDVYINPEIIHTEGEFILEEGCLSIPGIIGTVKRHHTVTVKGLNRKGEVFEKTYSKLGAAVVQHELDHLNGVLFIDRVEPDSLYAYDYSEAAKEKRRKKREEYSTSDEE